MDDLRGAITLRYRILFGFMAFCAIVVLAQFAMLMIFSPGEAEDDLSFTTLERGPILDRNGRILAIQTRLDSVTAWTPDVTDPNETAALLAPILEVEAGEILERLISAQGFVMLARTVAPAKSQQIERLLREEMLEGISLQPDTGRNYPERHISAAIVGYVGVDNVGLDGIEYTFDRQLSPNLDTAEGKILFGNQIFLTIDINIQYVAEMLAERALDEHDADSVMIMVMDSYSGELLAATSAPSFNPNRFSSYDAEERRNRIISLTYEPGSVFKIFSLSSFLELKGITTDDYFQTSGGYSNREADFRIEDLGDWGRLNAEGIIKYSSNVGAAFASDTVSSDSFYGMMKQFGFGEKTGIALNGEERALLGRPAQWSARTRATIAIGQEIGVTAIQMVQAATALGNQGVLIKPQIVSKIVSPSGRLIQSYERQPIRDVLTPHVASTMLRLMNEATKDGGTARRIRIDGLEISAKTGTAEVFDPEQGSYSDSKFVASCISIFPTETPRLIVYVVIQHPRGEQFYGGQIAAPIVKEMIEFLVPHIGIPRRGNRIVSHDGVTPVFIPDLPAFDTEIPDLSGLPKRTLLPLLIQDDMQVVIRGSGRVKRQDPKPGTPIAPGMILHLELE